MRSKAVVRDWAPVHLALSLFFIGGAAMGQDALNVITVAGTVNPFIGDNGPATAAALNAGFGLAADASGNVFIADRGNNRVRYVNLTGASVTLYPGAPPSQRVVIAPGNIATVGGTGVAGDTGDGGSAIAAQLNGPFNLALDPSGNLYVANEDGSRPRIRRIDASTGTITAFAGGGSGPFTDPAGIGDNGAATAAQFNQPAAIVFDASGNLLFADSGNHRVRKVTVATGIINTYAGGGSGPFTDPAGIGDGGAAASARLMGPKGLAFDSAWNLYIVDNSDARVRKVDTAGKIMTVAGTGTAGPAVDGGQAIAAQLNSPYGIAVDGSGNLYIGDQNNNRVRKVTAATGIITTCAGGGSGPFTDPAGIGDGGSAIAAKVSFPKPVILDATGNLFFMDGATRVRKVDSAGKIITVAGGGSAPLNDGGPATAAHLNAPFGLALDVSRNLYIAEQNNNRIRRVDTTGTINTIVGTGAPGASGDGGLAAAAKLNTPLGLAFDASGSLYIADAGNNRVRCVNLMGASVTLFPGAAASQQVVIAPGNIATVAGTGVAGNTGDSGPATSARLNHPVGLAFDPTGNLYISDQNNNRVRRVDHGTGIISPIAGTGGSGFTGDGGLATAATLNLVVGLALDPTGSVLYIVNQGGASGGKVRAVNLTSGAVTILGQSLGAHSITTVAGNLSFSPRFPGDAGDGLAATAAAIFVPRGVALDASGNLYVAGGFENRVRKVDTTGIITTVAGNGTTGNSGDGGVATGAQVKPFLLAFDASGNLYISEGNDNRVRRLQVAARVNLSPYDAGNVAARIEFSSHDIHAIDFSSVTIQAIDPASHIPSSAPLPIGTQPAGYPLFGDFDNNGVADVTVVLPMPSIPSYPSELRVQGRFTSGQYFSADVNDANACQIDTTPPILASSSCQDIPALECTGSSGAPVPLPGATDDCDAHPAVSCSPASVSLGTPNTAVTCTAQDHTALPANVSASCNFKVTVVDTTKPTVTCPADILNVPNDPGLCSAQLDPGTATASDTCDPSPKVSGTRGDAKALTDPYPADATTTITWIATDASGNVSDPCTQTITVKDTEPPSVAFQAGSPAANQYGWNKSNVTAPFTVSDNCSGPVATSVTSTATCSENATSDAAGDGSVVLSAEGAAVTCTLTATDDDGNSAPFTTPAFKIDKTPPTITSTSVSPSTLWPPNHFMTLITLALSIQDNLDLIDTGNPVQSIGLTSSQLDASMGTTGDTNGGDGYSGVVSVQPAAFNFGSGTSGSSSTNFLLRAERVGSDLNGRIYTVYVTASDAAGNTASVARTVWVPHDQSATHSCGATDCDLNQ